MDVLGVARHGGKIEVPLPLAQISASALRFLCGMYRIPRGGSKAVLIRRLLTSGYPIPDFLMRAQELELGDRIVPYLHRKDLENRLENATLPVSGSRKEQVLRLIENRCSTRERSCVTCLARALPISTTRHQAEFDNSQGAGYPGDCRFGGSCF